MENPANGLAIAVLAGNAATGKSESGVEPSNAWPVLPGQRTQTVKRIARNREVVMYRAHFHFSSVPSGWPPPLTYFLVHCIDVDAGAIRGELSLPTRLDGGYITEWNSRIILPPPLDGLESTVPVDDDEGEPIVIDIVDKAI